MDLTEHPESREIKRVTPQRDLPAEGGALTPYPKNLTLSLGKVFYTSCYSLSFSFLPFVFGTKRKAYNYY